MFKIAREQFDVYAVWQEVFAKTIDAAKDEMDPTFLAQLYTTTQEVGVCGRLSVFI